MRKFLAIIVSFAVILAMIPTMAFAAVDTESVNVTLAESSATYTGRAITPIVTVTDTNGHVSSSEYVVTYKQEDTTVTDLKNPGTYKVVVTGTGWSKEADFTINKLDPSKVTGSITPKAVGTTVKYNELNISFMNGSTPLTLTAGTEYSFVGVADPATEGINVALGSVNNVKIKYNSTYFTSDAEDNIAFSGKYNLASYSFVAADPSTSPVYYTPGMKYTTTFTPTDIPTGAPKTPTYTVTYTTNDKVTGLPINAKLTGTGDFMGEVTVPTGVTIQPRSIKNCKYTVETSSSSTIAPKAKITDGSYTLVEGKDYKVSYSGTPYYANITGIGNYVDMITDVKFSVGSEITDASLSSYSFVYNGLSQKPSVTVKAGEVTVPSTGYRIEWDADTTNQGTKTVKIIGVGSYSGEKTLTYTITKKYVDKLSISLSGSSFKATGQYIEPTVTVKDGTTILKKDKDYTISYAGNVSASYTPATATVTLIGNYYGSKAINFYLGSNPASGLTVTLDKSSYNYTGTEIKPTVTVKNGTTTVSASNYDVEYKNNKAVGTGTVVLIFKYGYYGTIEKTFTITGKTVSNCTVTLSQTTYAADGTEKKPTVVVKDGTKTLVNGTDYTVTYANNKSPGNASVIITGKGGYSGTKTEYFKITGLSQYITIDQDEYTKYPTSSPFKLNPTCNGDGTGFTFTSSDSGVASVAADGTVTLKAPGRAVITIATKGDVKYTPASETVTITVKPNKGSLAKLGTPAKRSLRVYINKRTGVDGYQVRYTRGTGYKYFTAKHVTSVYKTQYRTVRYLKSGYTYKVQVRAYKILDDGTKLYGSWSTAKSLKVK